MKTSTRLSVVIFGLISILPLPQNSQAIVPLPTSNCFCDVNSDSRINVSDAEHYLQCCGTWGVQNPSAPINCATVNPVMCEYWGSTSPSAGAAMGPFLDACQVTNDRSVGRKCSSLAYAY